MQWWPARTQTPSRSRIWATSWGWMPGRLKGTTPPRTSAGGPYRAIPGTSRGEHLERVRDELALVLAHAVHPQLAQVVGGDAEADRGGDVRRAGLELPGDVVELGPAQLDLADHVAAGHERRHRVEQLAAAPQDAGAGRAQHLVAGEDVEVGAQLLHVDRQVRHRLGAVDEDERAGGVGHLDHLADRVDRAQRVRDVGEGDELRVEPQEHLEDVEAEDPVVGDRDELQVAVHLLGQDLPRDEVRVVLHLGEDDRVALAQVAAAPAVGDEVDRLGRVAGPDDLAVRRRVDEAGRPGRGRPRRPPSPSR